MSNASAPNLMTKAVSRGMEGGRRLRLKLTARPSPRHALVGQPHLWAMKRRFQFDFLVSRGLEPHHRLLDIGCGTLRGGIPLIEYLQAGHYVGVEARAEVLDEGRRELIEAGLAEQRPLLIHAADPAEVKLDRAIDVAWAFSVLIHMPDDVVRACLDLVADSLSEAGVLYANVDVGEGQSGRWQGFPVLSRPLERYREWASSSGLTMSELGALATLGHKTGTSQDQQVMLRFTASG